MTKLLGELGGFFNSLFMIGKIATTLINDTFIYSMVVGSIFFVEKTKVGGSSKTKIKVQDSKKCENKFGVLEDHSMSLEVDQKSIK